MHTRSIGFLLILALLAGCSSSRQAANPILSRELPHFDYAVQQTARVGSSDVTIALVRPVYVSGFAAGLISPFPEMAKSMGNDFEELLTAKGFKIRGPFDQMGSMLFSDKKNSDFILEIEINLQIQATQVPNAHRKTDWGKAISGVNAVSYNYTFQGHAEIGGVLTMTALSPSFGEKLWKKNITLRNVPFDYAGTLHWDFNNASVYDQIKQDNAVYNVAIHKLEDFYNQTFDLLSQQIDVEEMKSVATEAKKAEKKN